MKKRIFNAVFGIVVGGFVLFWASIEFYDLYFKWNSESAVGKVVFVRMEGNTIGIPLAYIDGKIYIPPNIYRYFLEVSFKTKNGIPIKANVNSPVAHVKDSKVKLLYNINNPTNARLSSQVGLSWEARCFYALMLSLMLLFFSAPGIK